MTLALNDRLLLLDALRPPAGMALDAAVGTSFTLDLAALLAIPVSATLWRDDGRADDEDGVDVLETIRRYARSTVLFCQAGAISVPPRYRPALTFVEQTVVEVEPPTGGLFHPKTWVVRFASPTGRRHHRVLVMSRNLTFDRAWDVVVRLDEEHNPESRPDCDVSGLTRFLRYVPTRARRALTSEQRELVDDLTGTVGRVKFAVPADFDSAALVPLGIGRITPWPFHTTCDHVLAVSPFLGGATAKRLLAGGTRWRGVLSRPASLDAVQHDLTSAGAEAFRLRTSVLSAEESVDNEPLGDGGSSAMRGLHAKFYVQDIGDRSTVWFGSANLTQAGFTRNVEVQVRLTGPCSSVGVDALVGWNGKARLGSIVEPHEYGDEREGEPEEGLSDLARLGYALASGQATVDLEPTGEDDFSAWLTLDDHDLPDGIRLEARLLSLKQAQPVQAGTASWEHVPLVAVTPFVVLSLRSDHDTHHLLVRADLRGDPGHRRGAVLAAAIRSRADFLRYLASLLQPFGAGHPDLGDVEADGGAAWLAAMRSDRVLEDLMTTASRSPERLRSLDATLTELQKTEPGKAVVPEEFWSLWKAVRSVPSVAKAVRS